MRIIGRDEAGLAPPAGRLQPVAWPRGVTLWVHHSDGEASRVLATTKAIVKAIQAFHVGPQRRWSDIGYAYLVDSAGNVIEGRGRHLGAHSPGKNHEPSVCMLGDYAEETPPVPMLGAIAWLADVLAAGELAGHRENTATTCPGNGGMRGIAMIEAGAFDPVEPTEPRKGWTLRERIIAAGYGPRSADAIVANLRAGRFGTVPRPTDRVMLRNLRERGGLGIESARQIVRAARLR